MTSQLAQNLMTSAKNEAVVTVLMRYEGKAGHMIKDEKIVPLKEDMIANFEATRDWLKSMIDESFDMLIKNNIVTEDSDTYCALVLDITKEFLSLPDLSALNDMNEQEINTLVSLQMKDMSIQSMRSALVDIHYEEQKEPILVKDLIAKQFEEIDDATIKDAYRTKLEIALKKAAHTQI